MTVTSQGFRKIRQPHGAWYLEAGQGDVALCVCMMFYVSDLCLKFMPESL